MSERNILQVTTFVSVLSDWFENNILLASTYSYKCYLISLWCFPTRLHIAGIVWVKAIFRSRLHSDEYCLISLHRSNIDLLLYSHITLLKLIFHNYYYLLQLFYKKLIQTSSDFIHKSKFWMVWLNKVSLYSCVIVISAEHICVLYRRITQKIHLNL